MTKIEGNHHIHGQKNIVFSYSDPGGTLEKTKQPKTLIKAAKEEIYVSKEVEESASEGKSCRPETITAENQYACHDLSA